MEITQRRLDATHSVPDSKKLQKIIRARYTGSAPLANAQNTAACLIGETFVEEAAVGVTALGEWYLYSYRTPSTIDSVDGNLCVLHLWSDRKQQISLSM